MDRGYRNIYYHHYRRVVHAYPNSIPAGQHLDRYVLGSITVLRPFAGVVVAGYVTARITTASRQQGNDGVDQHEQDDGRHEYHLRTQTTNVQQLGLLADRDGLTLKRFQQQQLRRKTAAAVLAQGPAKRPVVFIVAAAMSVNDCRCPLVSRTRVARPWIRGRARAFRLADDDDCCHDPPSERKVRGSDDGDGF